MKHPFPDKLINEAIIYCKTKYPEEACGFILENEFIPVENIAEDKEKTFMVNPKTYREYDEVIQAIVHSHANYPHVSKLDMIQQIESGVPWGLIALKNGAVDKVVFWGDQLEPYPLISREFVHGVHDCYGLMRDWHRLNGKIIPDYPRENLWWETQPSMLEDLCNDAGFYHIDGPNLEVGDIIFMKVLAGVTNHSAVYIGDGLMIHHLYGRLSRREPVVRWRRYITGYLRFFGDKKC
jgi:proteasome lid subunit RPN8/RPN11